MLPGAVQRVLYEADVQWGRGYRRARARLGLSKPPRIVPYRGWAHGERATILARVLEDRGAPEWRQGASLWQTFLASYKRYATLEIPEAELEVRWASCCWRARTDEEGHLTLVVSPAAVAAGWNRVELALCGTDVKACGEVLVRSSRARFVVVSDIDDTVIDTNVRHPIARAAALFLTDSRVRLPFAGVAALYRALHRDENPIFYVSSSPWNLYEHLCGLFDHHDIPKGPLLLRDWGITRSEIAPLGGHAHKIEKVNQLLTDHSDLPFVLIGDSGQEDARHYVAVAEHHRGQVAVIYIRDVGLRHRELVELARRAKDCGSELVVVEDSVHAAQHASSIGLIAPEDVARVREDRTSDERLPMPLTQAITEHV